MTYQAIVTKYIGPSNVRGSRVKATAQAGSVTLDWDDALSSDLNHKQAACKLAEKYQWAGTWFSGFMPDGTCAHVCTHKGDSASFKIDALTTA